MAIKAKDLTAALAKTARVLCEEDHPNTNTDLQKIVGDPGDTAISTFSQFKPQPHSLQIANPLSPIDGDDVFFTYMWPGATFRSHDGQEWDILEYDWDGKVVIQNRWYPRLRGIVSLWDVRRSIHSWIEPITQIVPPPPAGVDYGIQDVRIVER